ncbi:DUF2185 domain-containing protein [Corallococcus exiguus]|uniref:DUF2185 domain-containing protein n=1 Tax=Corallococcus TaxID=83461 RepID=UPI000F87DBBE|nr:MULTISPECIES: DUF2185 domain-containing protein [Corallococcus]NNC19112.1 DUF2185 domain-containing protein [Corallococcus exiguus]NRD53391.1 DUF2185 domain-containing protein [Corallococcus exiguus]RUO91937.1 DUF2185 domain-containing protein [Corallococcus sp. AB018]
MARPAKTPKPVELGDIDLPEGVLLILDPGLGRFWRHDSEPASPRKKAPAEHDLRISGPDAEAAGQAYDREFDPRFLFDRKDPADAAAHFEGFAREQGFDARAEVLSARIPHTERARLALEHGKGLGVVKYNGLWAVVVGGLPSSRGLKVIGMPMPPGEFGGRWRSIDIVVDGEAEAARSEQVSGVMVDHGQLLFAGLGPMGRFRMWEPEDGLADYVFHGRDAPKLAKELGASDLGDGLYGWKDLPMDRVGEKATPLQERLEKDGLAVGVDYRPHCNLEKLNAGLRECEEDTASLVLDGARVVGCGNRWGDGIFTVSRHLDAKGRTVRVRVELGTEERQKLLRGIRLRQRKALVTRFITENGEPIRFAERSKPAAEEDSGWLFTSGLETEEYMEESGNAVIVPLRPLLGRDKELDAILDAPVGAVFRREGNGFVPEE